MCLIIDPEKHPDMEPLIAESNIPVVKMLGADFFNTIFGGKHYKYTPGVVSDKLDKFSIDQRPRHNQINEGYHSFATIVPIIRDCEPLHKHEIVVKAIIPKGAKYFLGEEHSQDLVSDTLIVTDIVILDSPNEKCTWERI